jgi:DNA-directed RNA polymerase specialized sigma subunit
MTPHQKLAKAVLSSAREDLESKKHRNRFSAYRFFTQDENLSHWCAVLGISVEEVRQRVRPFIKKLKNEFA